MLQTHQLSESEVQMIEEIFSVFSKYADRTRRFGVQLVHSHFLLQDGEILYETNDKEKRELKVKAVAINKFKRLPLATAWQQSSSGAIEVTMFCCDDDDNDSGIDRLH